MTKTATRLIAVTASTLSAIVIATSASAATCTATCAGTDAAILGVSPPADAAGDLTESLTSKISIEHSYPAIRRPNGHRGPGLWTY